uniref:Large ribosomal subunit protein uL3m n=1 Tax=Gouania willdenowi TaxID=441366 RepID=A0A8C5HMD4_GOUWI
YHYYTCELRFLLLIPAPLVGCIRTVKTTTWFDEHLTEDNQKFMKKSIAQEYDKQTAENLNPLKDEPWERHEWTEGSRRVGLVAIKLGMAPIWTKTGERHVVTMLQVQDCHVVKCLSKEEYDGNTAALLVGGKNVSPFHEKFFFNRIYDTFLLQSCFICLSGTPLYAAHFRPGQFVDVTAKGVMKRGMGFKGQPATHGQTKPNAGRSIRTQDPGKVSKGKMMPGNWVWRVNTKYNVLYVNGSVPGHRNCVLKIRDTVLPTRSSTILNPPFPTYFTNLEEDIEEDLYDESLFVHTDPSITLT